MPECAVPLFGQSMHLLVDETVKRAQIEEQLRKVGTSHLEIHEIGPSLEACLLSSQQSTLGNNKKPHDAERNEKEGFGVRQHVAVSATCPRTSKVIASTAD